MNYKKIFIFLLNPIVKYNLEIEEYLVASKGLE